MIDCVELVSNMQGVCIWFAFLSKLVRNVGRIGVWHCVSWNCREQRKLPPKTVWLGLPPCSNFLAMVYAMVVLPEPAWPVSQKTRGLANEPSLAHLVMSPNILIRVPSVHTSRFRPCWSRTVLWSAFREGQKFFRASFCSINQSRSQARKLRYLPWCHHVSHSPFAECWSPLRPGNDSFEYTQLYMKIMVRTKDVVASLTRWKICWTFDPYAS